MINIADGNQHNQNQLSYKLDMIQEVDQNEEKTVKSSGLLIANSLVSDLNNSKLIRSCNKELNERNKIVNYSFAADQQENLLRKVNSEPEIQTQVIELSINQQYVQQKNDLNVCINNIVVVNNQNDKQNDTNQLKQDKALKSNIENQNVEEKLEIDEQIAYQDISEQSSNTYQYIYDDENSSDSFIDEKVNEFRQTNMNGEDNEEDNQYEQQVLSATLYSKGKFKELRSATFKKVDEEDVEEEDDNQEGKHSYKKRNNYFIANSDIIKIPSNSFAKKQFEQIYDQEYEQQQNNSNNMPFIKESCVKTPTLNTQDSNYLENVDRKVFTSQPDQIKIQRQFSFKGTQSHTETSEINQGINENENSSKNNLHQKLPQISSHENIERNKIFCESNQTKQKGILKCKPQNQDVSNMNLFIVGASDDQDQKNQGNSPFTCQYKTENAGWEYQSTEDNYNSQNKERVRSEEKNNCPTNDFKLEPNTQHANSLNTTGYPFPKSGRSIVHSYRNPLDITEREQQILKSKRLQQKALIKDSILNEQPNSKINIQQDMLISTSKKEKILNIYSNIKQIKTQEDENQQQLQISIANGNQSQLNEIQDQNNNEPKNHIDQQISIQNILATQGSIPSLNQQSDRRLSINNIAGINSCLINIQQNSALKNNDGNNTVCVLQKQLSDIQHEITISGQNPQNFSESPPSIRSRLCQTQNIQDNLQKQIENKLQSRVQSQQKYPYSEIKAIQNQYKSELQSAQLSTSTTNQQSNNTNYTHNNSQNNIYTSNGYPSPPFNSIGISLNNSNINPQCFTNLNSISNSQNQILQNYNKQYLNQKPQQNNGNLIKQKQFNIQIQQGNGVVSQNGANSKISSLNSSLVRRGNKRKIISPNSNLTNKQSPSFIIQSHKIDNSNQIIIQNQNFNQEGKQNTHQTQNYNKINTKGSSQMSPNNLKYVVEQQRGQQIYSLSQQNTITNSNQKYPNKQNNHNNSGVTSCVSQYNNSNNSIFSNQIQPLQMLNCSSIHQPSVLMLGTSNTLTPMNIQKNENTQYNIQGRVIPSSKETFSFHNQSQQNNPYINFNQNSQFIFTEQQQQLQMYPNQQISPKVHQRNNQRSKSYLYTQQQQDNTSIDVPSLLPAIPPLSNTHNIQALSAFNGQEGGILDVYGSFYYKTLNKSSVMHSPKRFSIDYPNVQSSISSQSNTRQIVKDILKRQLNNQNNTTHTKINQKLKKTTQIYLGNNTTSIYSGISTIQNQNIANNNLQSNIHKISNTNTTNMNDSLVGTGNVNPQLNNLTQYSYDNDNLMSSLSVIGNGCYNGNRNNMQILNNQQYLINNSTNTKTFRGAQNEDTQYTLKTLPSAISLADCQQNITQQFQNSNPQQIYHQNNSGIAQYLCHSTRPSRKQNQGKANSLNQRDKAIFNRNSSLYENSHGSQSYISTFNTQNNISSNSQNNNSYTTKNNLQTLKLDNNSKKSLNKYIRASSELRKRPIRQINSIYQKANNCNKNSYNTNNSQNINQSVWLSINGTSTSNQNDYISKQINGQQINNQFNNYYTNNNEDILQGAQIKITRSIQETPQKNSKIKFLYERMNSQPDEISYEYKQ